MQRALVVVVSPVLPHARMDNAGGLYVQALKESLEADFDVAFICPDVPANRRALDRDGTPARFVLVGNHTGGRAARLLNAAAHRLAAVVARLDVTAPPVPFSLGLVHHPEARSLLGAADVIDVQWSEMIRLAPVLTRLTGRRTPMVGTFHDVLSQRYRRYASAAEPSMPVWAWGLASRIAARSERAAQRRFRLLLTLSEKDRTLLLGNGPARTRIEVVDPPLHRGTPPSRHRSADPTVVFVGSLSRDDNIDAVEWLMADVWPEVRRRVPEARLSIVGSHAHDRVRAAVRARPGVELSGFVPDLADVYGSAWASVIPLRIGAGIKFKTIEALVAGVPTVTTTVGAEGIGDSSLFAAVVDHPRDFADGIVAVLSQPDEADERAEAAARWARETYSVTRFDARVRELYAGVAGTVGDPS